MAKVNTTHPDFDKFIDKWTRCRHVSDGQDAVHRAGTKYLPKLADQEPDEYTAYKARVGFYNATWRTLSGLLGMMFRKPPAKDLPGGLASYEDDIDMAGTSLETMARKVALEVLEVGRVGIMVDHPRTENVAGISVKAAQEQGLRPMITTYRAECITNWKYRRVRNRWVLAMVVLKETHREDEDEFKEKEIEQYRVLDLDETDTYRVRVFRKKQAGNGNAVEFEEVEEFWPLMNNKRLDYIPFAIVGPDGIDSELDEPPLIDLVDLNLAHYRVTADYEHGCHFTGLPTLFLSGFGADETGAAPSFRIGSQAAIVAPHPEADGKYIEFTGQGLDALQANLDRKEQQMAILGARMIAEEKRVAETATTAAIHRTGENSVLASIAMAVSEALEWALDVFSDWTGGAGEVTYQLNRDYNPAMLSAPDITAYMKAVQMGMMSPQSFHELMQRADVIDSERSYEEEQELIGQMGPPRPDAANDGQGSMVA